MCSGPSRSHMWDLFIIHAFESLFNSLSRGRQQPRGLGANVEGVLGLSTVPCRAGLPNVLLKTSLTPSWEGETGMAREAPEGCPWLGYSPTRHWGCLLQNV